jgi:hypothetical protein
VDIRKVVRNGQVKVGGKLVIDGRSRRLEDARPFTKAPVEAEREQRRKAKVRAKRARKANRQH